jgi:hypothetical protein
MLSSSSLTTTDELAILKYLNDIKSETNETVELHCMTDNSAGKVVALGWGILLDPYSNWRLTNRQRHFWSRSSRRELRFYVSRNSPSWISSQEMSLSMV